MSLIIFWSFVSERKQVGDLLATLHRSKLNFSYEILEKATNYFQNSNKLGQGGSGSVYKVISGIIIYAFEWLIFLHIKLTR